MNELYELSYFNAQFSYLDGVNSFTIQLDISSKDIINDLGIVDKDFIWTQDFLRLKEQVLGKSINDLVIDDCDKFNAISMTLLMAIEDYTGHLHQNIKDYGKNTDELICRCQAVDLKELKTSIDKHSADAKKVIQELKVSLVCGGCRSAFDKIISMSDWKKNYFADIENSRWCEMIYSAFQRAKELNNPIIPLDLDYSIIKYQNNQVKLRVNGDRKGKNRFELTSEVEDFLKQKIHPEIKVSLVV